MQATVRGQGGVATAPHLAAGVTAGADRLADEATAGEQTLNQTDSRCGLCAEKQHLGCALLAATTKLLRCAHGVVDCYPFVHPSVPLST